MIPSEILSAFVLLALVIDPFGNVPLVNAMLADVAPEQRARIVARECLIAYVTLDEGVTMMTNIVNADTAKLAIGQKVRVALVESENGQKVPMFEVA